MQQALFLNTVDLENLKREICAEICNRIEALLAMQGPERAVSREKMAELLGVGIATIDRLVRDGVIPSMMPCNRRLFLPSQVYAALQAIK